MRIANIAELVTAILGGLTLLGTIGHFLRKVSKWLTEWVETMQALRDLTEQFVKGLVEDEQRFQRIERHLGLPPWQMRQR